MKSTLSKLIVALVLTASVVAGTIFANPRPVAACGPGGGCGGTIGILSIGVK